MAGKLVEHLKDLFRANADAVILAEVAPADGTGRVDEEFSRARDVTLRPTMHMQQVVVMDHFTVRIG